MSKDSKQRNVEPVNNRKILDRAFILPLIGVVLLLSPLAKIFQINTLVAGIPFTVVYLFVVWGMLIAGAVYLSKKLRNHQLHSDIDDITDDEIDQ